MCVGGSTTWSSEVKSPRDSYPAQLERYLCARDIDVDVVNGGVSYYTSAEVLGAMAFRGVHTQPDIVLIHTAGNDLEPFLSPRPYKADYTHWRVAPIQAQPDRNMKFVCAWGIPSWTVRLGALLHFRPKVHTRHALGRQLTFFADSFFSTGPLETRRTVGLERNLRSLIALCRSVGAAPVTILFRIDPKHPNSCVYWDKRRTREELANAEDRMQKGMAMLNEVMRVVSRELDVPVFPFDEFDAPAEVWVDHCHLNEEGCRLKAVAIGDFLLEQGLVGRGRRDRR
ncbi:SGNH/GDSL hydrolase family protein [Planctomycetota bacterium]